MTKKLYVGNLSYTTNENELRTIFTEAGQVASVSIVTDRDTGQSRGFAFVEMETEEGAQEAIRKPNNREVNRRNITISEARPPRERSFGDGGGRGFGGGGGGDRGRGGFGGRGGDDRGRGGSSRGGPRR